VQLGQLGHELGVGLCGPERGVQLVERRDEGLGDEAPAVRAESADGVVG